MAPFSLKISSDKLRAYLTLNPTSDETLALADLLNQLRTAGVAADIDTQIIQEALDQKKWGESLLIGKGREPIRGKNGSVEYHFDTHPKFTPKIKEDGGVDYRNLNITQNVVAGQELAKLIPPEPGEDGIDVFGKPLPAPRGKIAKLSKSKNTSFTDPDNTIVKADIDGNVKMSNSGAVEVDASFTVGKDVDFNTGNIDIKGDLVIQGDVKAGFKVKASGEIDIGGTVEDAEIETDGSVLVKRGFLGDGHGVIKAGKNVIIRFIHGQKVVAGADIHLHEESIQSDLTAGDSIIAQDGKGIIIGGIARAGKTLIVKTLGNTHYIKTEINVAEKSGLRERIAQITKDLGGLEAKMAQITDKMMFFMNKSGKLKLSTIEENEFRVLDKLSADITVTQETLKGELRELESKLNELRSLGLVRILKLVYPGTILRIAGLVKEINEERGPGDYKVVEGAIVYHSH